LNEKIGDYLITVGKREMNPSNHPRIPCYKIFNEATGLLEFETTFLHRAYNYVYDGVVQTQAWKSAAMEAHENQVNPSHNMMLPDADMMVPDVGNEYGPQ